MASWLPPVCPRDGLLVPYGRICRGCGCSKNKRPRVEEPEELLQDDLHDYFSKLHHAAVPPGPLPELVDGSLAILELLRARIVTLEHLPHACRVVLLKRLRTHSSILLQSQASKHFSFSCALPFRNLCFSRYLEADRGTTFMCAGHGPTDCSCSEVDNFVLC